MLKEAGICKEEANSAEKKELVQNVLTQMCLYGSNSADDPFFDPDEALLETRFEMLAHN